ncbi:unnamed protein product [Candidula unifasciata]|uniref:Uncharacterized protein n=1 Tax=Candidula unifasciata TaxID=100452 RepID=A0A8S3YZK6_9EUPU|nr:unnamed protein product [Candidula unifasciata]
MPQDRGQRRRHNRSRSGSPSPGPSKHKRSWQNSAGERFGEGIRERHNYRHVPSPVKGGKRDFRSPAKVSDRRNYSDSLGVVHKSHPAHIRKTGHSEGELTCL